MCILHVYIHVRGHVVAACAWAYAYACAWTHGVPLHAYTCTHITNTTTNNNNNMHVYGQGPLHA